MTISLSKVIAESKMLRVASKQLQEPQVRHHLIRNIYNRNATEEYVSYF